MRFVARLLGKKQEETREPTMSRLQVTTREQTRRELISMALRDTLRKHRLAAGCITAEGVPSHTRSRERGMHIQLVFREWQPSVLSYVVALEAAMKGRLARLDPISPGWVTGLSWRFEPRDPSLWPQLLPTRELADSSQAPGSASDGLLKLLEKGDGAFQGGLGATADFSPTLPMARAFG